MDSGNFFRFYFNFKRLSDFNTIYDHYLAANIKKNFVNFLTRLAIQISRKNNTIIKIISGSLWDLPSPARMSYFWNFGSTLGICLVIQILTGILLTLHYTSFSQERFNSVVEIIREV